MDPLEFQYDDINSVPEPFRGLYAENNGKFVLTNVRGIKSQADVDYVRSALEKERNDHRQAKESLRLWDGLKPNEVRSQLDRITELEALAGKVDDNAINTVVESRIKQKLGPVEQELNSTRTNLEKITQERDVLQQQIVGRDRADRVRSAATEMKSHSTAVPDIEMAAERMLEQTPDGRWITKDGIEGITPGVDVKQWLKEMQRLRPHWWPESSGGGANGTSGMGGSSGSNPWTTDGWNMTQQAAIYRADPATAARLSKAAGTSVGGLRPKKS